MIHASQEPFPPGSSEADEMVHLSILIGKYEREHYQIKAPDPVEAIRFRMDQMNLKQKDIAPFRVTSSIDIQYPTVISMMESFLVQVPS